AGMLHQGADPNMREFTRRSGLHIWGVEIPRTTIAPTLLIIATIRGDEEMVQVLLHFGADVNLETTQGMNALDFARDSVWSAQDRASADHILRMLLQSGGQTGSLINSRRIIENERAF